MKDAMRESPRRRAFTLAQLLLVVTLAGIILGAIASVQRVRRQQRVWRECMASTNYVSSTQFTQDGELLVAIPRRSQVRIYNLNSGEAPITLDQAATVRRLPKLAFARDGTLLATIERDGVKVWDLADGRLVHSFKSLSRSPDSIQCIASSWDARILAIGEWRGGLGGTANLSELGTGKEVLRLNRPAPYRRLSFSPDRKILAAVGSSDVKLHEVTTGRELATFYPGSAEAIVFSPDGTLLAWAGRDGEVHICDVATMIRSQILRNGEGVMSLAFAPDGTLLAAGGQYGAIKVWDTKSWRVKAGWSVSDAKDVAARTVQVAFSPDGASLATVNWERPHLKFWQVDTGQRITIAPRTPWLLFAAAGTLWTIAWLIARRRAQTTAAIHPIPTTKSQ